MSRYHDEPSGGATLGAVIIVIGCIFGVGFCAKTVFGGDVEGLQATVVEIGTVTDKRGCAPVKLKYEGGSCIGPRFPFYTNSNNIPIICYPMIGMKVCDTRTAH